MLCTKLLMKDIFMFLISEISQTNLQLNSIDLSSCSQATGHNF